MSDDASASPRATDPPMRAAATLGVAAYARTALPASAIRRSTSSTAIPSACCRDAHARDRGQHGVGVVAVADLAAAPDDREVPALDGELGETVVEPRAVGDGPRVGRVGHVLRALGDEPHRAHEPAG